MAITNEWAKTIMSTKLRSYERGTEVRIFHENL